MKKELVLILLMFSYHLFAQDVTKNISTISTLIKDAVAAKAKEVVIPSGIYRGNSNFIVIENVSDLKIIADNVTMICEKTIRAFELKNCKNITISGLTIDYDPLPFTQGDIIAVGTNYIDVKIHKGYAVQPYSRIDVIDRQTRYRKRGSLFVWGSTAQVIGTDVVRVTQTNLPTVAKVGDMASMSMVPEGAVHTFVVTDCKGGIVLNNLTINTGPGFGIFEVKGEGGTILDGCKIVRGSKPVGATEERLLTTIWDAIQHKLTHRGPIVKNCVIQDAGDDSWSVTWDGDYQIASVTGNKITAIVKNSSTDASLVLQVGDTLRTSLSSDAVKITNIANGVLTLDKTCPWSVNTRFYSPDRRCEHFIFSNNYIHSSGRVLVKSGHGVIENNFLDNSGKIVVNTEMDSGAAVGIDSLAIQNNYIVGIGHFMPASWSSQAGAISITDGSSNLINPVGSYSNLVIESNKFKDVSGVNIVVTSSSNINIKENKFYQTGISTPNNTGESYGIDQNTVVYTKNCDKLTMDYNIVYQLGLTARLKLWYVTNFVQLRGAIFVDNSSNDQTSELYIKAVGVNEAVLHVSGDTIYNKNIDDNVYNRIDFGKNDNITITPQKEGYEFFPASQNFSKTTGINLFSFTSKLISAPNAIVKTDADKTKIFTSKKGIVVELEHAPTSIAIYNSSGILVEKFSTCQTSNVIPVNRSGLYIVKVDYNGKSIAAKVMIKS